MLSLTPLHFKTCSVCKEYKSVEFYTKEKNRPGKYKARCKSCHAKIERNSLRYKNYKIDKVKAKSSYLKRFYGIDLKQYNELLTKQNEVCAICLEKEKIKNQSLAVDHCHKTNKVRGLLCFNCNISIGKLRDSEINLTRAISYLKGEL